jgi:hypothetical protein
MMSTKPRATIEDLYKVEGKAELINGEIVEMPPSGDDPNRASVSITMSLRQYERRTGQGWAYGDGAGFKVHLPRRESFSPDAAYHLGPRTGMRFSKARPSSLSKFAASTITARRPSGPCTKNVLTILPAGRWWCGTWIY